MLVAALIGWWLGAGSRDRHAEAAGSVWEAVDDAAKAAMRADSESLPAHAADLQRVLRARLGKTLFGGDLDQRARALFQALEGESAPEDGRRGPEPLPDETMAPAPGHAPAAAAAPAANVTLLSIHPPAAFATPGEPARGPMTARARKAALRLAVAEFNDYWRHRSAREADMRAVAAELCNPGPRRRRLSHGGDRH